MNFHFPIGSGSQLNCSISLVTTFFKYKIFGIELSNYCVTVSGQSTGMKADKEVGALTQRNGYTNAAIASYIYIYILFFVFIGGGDFS